MAKIVGGLATSHTPTIAIAKDQNKQNDPVWAPIFKGYEPMQKWLADTKPDVLLYIYNDHMTSFFADHYSHWALGIGDEYSPADEGGGARDLPPIKGDTKFAQHIAFCLAADEFDLSFFQGKGLDHGAFSPLSLLLPHSHEKGWPVRLVPLQCGVLLFPTPSARRCYKLGRALRKAIESYPEDIKVAIVGTGGLSHQVHGERCGFNNTPWDMEFLDRLTDDPESLLDITITQYAELGGVEGAEIIMWLIMRGALSKKVKRVHQTYYLPSMTAISTLILEEASDEPWDEKKEDYLARVTHEWVGVDKLEGTYPFTVEWAVKAFRLNSFLHSLVDPDKRKAFRADEEAAMAGAGLTDEEKIMLRNRDWLALIRYGVIFFSLEKFAVVVGQGNMDIYAAMRGMSLDEFQKTRNTSVTYSVAGKED